MDHQRCSRGDQRDHRRVPVEDHLEARAGCNDSAGRAVVTALAENPDATVVRVILDEPCAEVSNC